jgi:hypothetical protein
MSVTGFVLAFAGALAAKVRPASPERRLEAFELKADLEAAHWALETMRSELEATRDALRQVRGGCDALTHWRDCTCVPGRAAALRGD